MVTVIGKIGSVNTQGFVPGGFASDIELAGAGAACPVIELLDHHLEVKPMILEHPDFYIFADVTGSSTAWAKIDQWGENSTVTSGSIVV
jgi:hypothetical protein